MRNLCPGVFGIPFRVTVHESDCHPSARTETFAYYRVTSSRCAALPANTLDALSTAHAGSDGRTYVWGGRLARVLVRLGVDGPCSIILAPAPVGMRTCASRSSSADLPLIRNVLHLSAEGLADLARRVRSSAFETPLRPVAAIALMFAGRRPCALS